VSWDHLDESDVRVRPGRGSRPRTKDRPAHGDALVGTVVTVDRGRYGVLMAAGVGGRKVPERMVVAMKARELGRKGIVVGDDGLARPAWASVDPLLREYYDHEWGLPVRDTPGVYERITLEGFQSGLSWETVLGT